MGLLFNLLTLPVSGPVKSVTWIAEKLIEQAESEELDEDRIKGELLELQVHFELDEISQEEYDQQEAVLLEQLSAIREAKEEDL
ncbi:MAG: gas vesicle protein GvpG [Chloroflexi bacterium]|nr:gas vesicle protein GvpG [Chloroflexota bacterium]